MINTKLLILGGGPAGYVSAIRASQLGINAILVEEKDLGGVCLNVGCIPTKALLKTSELYNQIKNSKDHGITSSLDNLNWDISIKRKDRIVKNLNKGVESLLKSKNIQIINGRGFIIDKNNVVVKTSEGDLNIFAEKIILATGSKTSLPPIDGINSKGVLTSTEALELETLPETIVIIGAGVIGLEFASIFKHIGSKVIVIEQEERILTTEDKDISLELQKILKRQGINFKLSSTINKITEEDNLLKIVYQNNEKEQTQICNNILIATGRAARNSAFENLDIRFENGFVAVNENMQTNIENIYAAGDIVGGKLLAHLSFMEGKIAAENAFGITNKINYNAVPACIYTTPELATVGLSEEEAKSKNINYKIGTFSFRNNGRALTLGEREGFVKIIAAEDNTILGGQILANSASEMISEITLAVTLSIKADVIAEMIHPHPTLNEAVWEACLDVIGKPIHK